ncbi:hypothetical protein SAMN04489727_9182 [Amycolatopsis tolypomycina]|uniref:Uncharacterized protein n=1 Tax=Amycolatopsis tolypomycina TaxID=208445 RepID=A0A1H5D6E4_9PSEU|nr:hypothetical protein SAMN04489727_9182 [Amycolatopsis tolypomycina]
MWGQGCPRGRGNVDNSVRGGVLLPLLSGGVDTLDPGGAPAGWGLGRGRSPWSAARCPPPRSRNCDYGRQRRVKAGKRALTRRCRPCFGFGSGWRGRSGWGAGRVASRLPVPGLLVPALPCPALPCPALPCPALPCPALPCPALPRPAPPRPPCPRLPRSALARPAPPALPPLAPPRLGPSRPALARLAPPGPPCPACPALSRPALPRRRLPSWPPRSSPSPRSSPVAAVAPSPRPPARQIRPATGHQRGPRQGPKPSRPAPPTQETHSGHRAASRRCPSEVPSVPALPWPPGG